MRAGRFALVGLAAGLLAAVVWPAAGLNGQPAPHPVAAGQPGGVARQGQPPPVAHDTVLVGLTRSLPSRPDRAALAGVDLAGVNVRAAEPVFRRVTGRSAAIGMGQNLDRIYRLRLTPGSDVLAAVSRLRGSPDVAFAEPDYLAHVLAAPNDPLYGSQAALSLINAASAWDVTTGSSEVVIAFVDSGLDTAHPDLAAQIWTNPGEIAGNGLDDDTDGYADDLHGWNFVDGNANLTDSTGHGTQVAAIAAAATNNGVGVAGLCWVCKVMVVKVAQPTGVANYSDIAAGVLYAAQKGARVINVSLGGSSDSATLKAAVQAASATSLVVGGAGNDNSSAPFYPAAYDGVLAVAGTTATDAKVASSNYGTWVAVSAPGEGVQSAFAGGGYGTSAGTSIAAPFASGLAGLIRAKHPDWSPAMVRAQIRQTTDSTAAANPTYAGQLGTGRVNAGRALTTTPESDLQVASYAADATKSGALKAGATISLVVTLRNDWLDASNVIAVLSSDGQVTVTKGTASFGPIAAGQSGANTADAFQVAVASGAYGRSVTFTLSITANGATYSRTFVAPTESSTATVGGVLTANTTWTSDRTYRVTGNAMVNPGVVLTIQPGTRVLFDEGKLLIVRGTLVADGLPAAHIVFTATNPPVAAICGAPIQLCSGFWGGQYLGQVGGILFTSESQSAQYAVDGSYVSGSILRYVELSYANGGVSLGGVSPFIASSTFSRNYSTALLGFGQPVITGNTFTDNSGGFVANFYGGCPTLTNNTFAANAGDIRLSAGPGTCSGGRLFEFSSNTVTGNAGAILLGGSQISGIVFRRNNLLGNLSQYDVVMGTGAESTAGVTVDGSSNYWGTPDTGKIQSRIFDFSQNPEAGAFGITPALSAPDPGAPPVLSTIGLAPGSPVGIQRVTFSLGFSADMDTTVDPTVSFAPGALAAGSTPTPTTTWTPIASPTATATRTPSPTASPTAPTGSTPAATPTSTPTPIGPTATPMPTFGGPYAVRDSARWVDARTWSAIYDVTALVPRGAHTITVSGARSATGQRVPTDARFGFTVDYAGQITNLGPPGAVAFFVSGRSGDPTSFDITWGTASSSAQISLYQYELGSVPGATDVINWTTATGSGVSRSGLGLSGGQRYWVGLQARNAGGLWSPISYASFVAGQFQTKLFLPAVPRAQPDFGAASR